MLQIFFSLQITNNQQKKKVSMKNSSRKKGKTIVTYWVQYMYWFELRHINRTMNEKNEKKKKKSLRHLFSFGSYFFFSARRPFFVVSHFFFPIEANFCREQKKIIRKNGTNIQGEWRKKNWFVLSSFSYWTGMFVLSDGDFLCLVASIQLP